MEEVGYVMLTAEFRREGKRIVAFCPELGTATFGRSLPEAERKLLEAIDLHLDALEEVGERERFFAEHGIQLYRDRPDQPRFVPLAPDDTFVKLHTRPMKLALAAS